MDGNYEITDLNVTGAGKILKMKVNGKAVDVVTDITKNADDEITAISINGTSQEIAGGGSADIEENKEATIDVSAYTEPVEIVPTEGKDGMAKCTVTLSNIPAGGSASAYAWKDNNDNILYLSFAESPADQTEYAAAYFLMPGASGHIGVVSLGASGATYAKVDANTFTSTFNDVTTTYTRDSADDLTLWETPDVPVNPGD